MTSQPPSSPRHANRLAASSSPYLLQHAHNPVDWWGWGSEAIAEARRRGVPIFLSAGYSTCYWCHVMERESFEDEATARVMNERFVCVKLDREERPEVDEAYMAAVQMLTGSGGWPMSVFIEPAGLRPFWGGTYFPPRPAFGRPSFTQVLERMSEAWRGQREEIVKQAEAVASAVREHLGGASRTAPVGAEQVRMALSTLVTIFDRANGGFGGAPKFPQATYLEFVLAMRGGAGDESTRDAVDTMLRRTLDAMACGGMFDQVGGGFHRYSVDAVWLVPHFEKMLYDQAQLLGVYAESAKTFGDEFLARAARRTALYVLLEMTASDGAFYTAQDAEVDGREGLNYLWTTAEVAAALDPAQAEFASAVYGVTDGPNFRDPHHPKDEPRNVLRLGARPEVVAERMGMPVGEFLSRLDAVNERLLAVRAERKQPRRDDKVLAAWNGMMIEGLARVGAALGELQFTAAAGKAADAILGTMRGSDGGLMRTRGMGGAEAIDGVLEDYAWMIRGLLALERADAARATHWLANAEALMREATGRFEDAQRGGFYETAAGREDLFVRPRGTYDGAIPSAGSVMLHNLLDLHRATGRAAYLDAAVRGVASVSGAIAEGPLAAVNSVRALYRLLGEAPESLTERLAEAGAVGGDAAAAALSSAQVVEVFASDAEVEVGPDRPAELSLRLAVGDGYHLNAHDAGEASGGVVIPLRVRIVGGSGVVAYGDYPAGEPFEGAQHRVHSGEIEFAVVLERTGELSGRPRLAVDFQACTDRACLSPATVELSVDIREVK